MQIQLFPDDRTPEEVRRVIRSGQAGPVRFAATATSYPHLTRLLVDLVDGHEALSPAADQKA